jgi:aspartyl-tRNA(Asn)/glutamyl-tRNA(Gln) amidotransferase subunit A
VEQLPGVHQRSRCPELDLKARLRVAPLPDLTAAQLGAAYAQGELSPVDVTRALLAHIERWEPQLCATYALDASAALTAASASEQRWLAGQPLSALDGVPCTLKENIATRGVPVPLGCAATVLAPAAADAPPAARLREAGCVILCKTTMPDWGMLSSGLSSFHRLTRNPWNLSLNPGGSSAGAAAAAAAGYAPLHLGTDIGGSIRLPAGWCGVVGFKPSNGRVPIYPPYIGRVAGPITRTVQDAAAMMVALTGPDARDTMSLPAQAIDWTDLTCRPRGLRLGLLMDAGWGTPVDAEVAQAVQQAAAAFERVGASVEPLLPFARREMIEGLDRFWRMRSWLDYRQLSVEQQAHVLPYIREWISAGEHLSGEAVFHGFSQIGAFREAAVAACEPFDFVLSPVSPEASFPAEWAGPTNDPQRPFEHIAFTVPFNMSEQPAISIDCGQTADGRPIGLQIVGRRHDDLGVLRMARLWEQLRPAPRPWPTPAIPS